MLLRTWNEGTSSYQSASGIKKRKSDNLSIETTQQKPRPSKEKKAGTNTNTSVIPVVKKLPSAAISISDLGNISLSQKWKKTVKQTALNSFIFVKFQERNHSSTHPIVLLTLKMKISSQRNFGLKILPYQDSIWMRQLMKGWNALKKITRILFFWQLWKAKV